MPSDRPRWFSLRTLLVLVLVLWNGYFAAALIYEQIIQTPSNTPASAILVWLWIIGDAAILLCSWVLRMLVRRRPPAA